MARSAATPISVSNPKLADAGAAFRRIPSTGALLRFAGNFDLAGITTHIQGATRLPDDYVLSYSNAASDHGIMLVLETSDGNLSHTVQLPNDFNHRLFHAGGIQRVGDVIAVPSETQDGFSAVVFLNAQSLVDQGKAEQVAAPIQRRSDAMAVGITDISLGGRTRWIAAVFQKGRVDFYGHDDLLDPTVDWRGPIALSVREKNHQSFLLFAETSGSGAGSDDCLYAVGLNHGDWFYSHRATLYRVAFGNGQPSAIDRVDSREDFDFKSGATLRFGGGMEVLGSDFELDGTNRVFNRKCVIERFGPGTVAATVKKVARVTKGKTTVTEVAPGITLVALPSSTPDLREGVIIVLSGGPFEAMNPPEVLDHMDRLIADVNGDPWLQERTAGAGLRFSLLPQQMHAHLHQSQWRLLRDKLETLKARPLIIVGHSNGGAAAVDLAKTLAADERTVDLLITADSVATLDDVGDINDIPANVRFNLNSYVVPTPAWLLAPFPIGRRNRRSAGAPATSLVNVGLAYDLPGALAHRNAFYDLTGGDFRNGSLAYPDLMCDVILATLRGTAEDAIVAGIATELQVLSDRANVAIELESRALTRTLRPSSRTVVDADLQRNSPETAGGPHVTARSKRATSRQSPSRKPRTSARKRKR